MRDTGLSCGAMDPSPTGSGAGPPTPPKVSHRPSPGSGSDICHLIRRKTLLSTIHTPITTNCSIDGCCRWHPRERWQTMKFRSERDTLVEALAAAARAVSARATGATTGLHLVVKGNDLTVTGTTWISRCPHPRIEVIGLDDGESVVPAEARHRRGARARARRRDVRGGRGEGRDLRGTVALLPADLPGRRLPTAASPRSAVDIGASRRARRGIAPGRAGLVEQQRATAAHRRPADQQRRARCDSSRPTRTDSHCATSRDARASRGSGTSSCPLGHWAASSASAVRVRRTSRSALRCRTPK